MDEIPRFEGSAIVTNWFGHWPSLHDAEVLSASFRRGLDGTWLPRLCADMHAFQMTPEVDERGHFKCIKHCVIELRFHDVDNVELRNFTQQNVIDDISMSFTTTPDQRIRIAVEFESLTEMELRFSCSKAEVVGLTPGIPQESVYGEQS
jgi:hypothetical protein